MIIMQSNDFDAFTTTLTIGPQKSSETINRIGREIGGDKFLVRDFKKNGGYQRAIQLAKQYQIYRQNYCGCIYSLRNTIVSYLYSFLFAGVLFDNFVYGRR